MKTSVYSSFRTLIRDPPTGMDLKNGTTWAVKQKTSCTFIGIGYRYFQYCRIISQTSVGISETGPLLNYKLCFLPFFFRDMVNVRLGRGVILIRSNPSKEHFKFRHKHIEKLVFVYHFRAYE